ncbi:DUF4192 family protein [Pseudonocardia sp. KRD291]|uniref:DUF4192 family protein n=1 Tax=Pseudonocardia sp. KRD291 TaxID=2792007 RepID=UPI001C4A67BF|nr:DUF4192 family protein [Pseudonocardia sp. KRD291]MBW0101519.1 DUF4192 domain-containing protein [Pseudonocardia sp. KRD291]
MTVPTLRTAAELVAALPLLIGFHPAESVVLAAIGEDGRIDLTVRADLEPVGGFGPGATEMLALIPKTHRHTAALAVISAQPRSDALDDLARAAVAAGIRVAVSVYATATTPGAQWTCCCGCGEFGRVPEQNTHLQAQAVFNGQRTLPDRDAVAEVLRPDDEHTLARRARLLLAPGPTGPALDLERAIDGFLAAGVLTDAAVVELVRSLRDTDRSVAVLAARPGDLRLVLEALVRATPAAWAAGPAAFLALAALLHGDGVLADLAAQRAVAADTGARFPQLVARLVATYPSPDTVRELLTAL